MRRWLDPRFTVSFGGIEEPEDFAARAEAFARLIPLGVVSPAQAARLLHLPRAVGVRCPHLAMGVLIPQPPFLQGEVFRA